MSLRFTISVRRRWREGKRRSRACCVRPRSCSREPTPSGPRKSGGGGAPGRPVSDPTPRGRVVVAGSSAPPEAPRTGTMTTGGADDETHR
ncbi:hypothetical protein CZ774_01945 [Frigoribacterium sp. JB110]|nr:hypothetical protein CZ774_01945 [Frigoribacterium sp. JB110]